MILPFKGFCRLDLHRCSALEGDKITTSCLSQSSDNSQHSSALMWADGWCCSTRLRHCIKSALSPAQYSWHLFICDSWGHESMLVQNMSPHTPCVNRIMRVCPVWSYDSWLTGVLLLTVAEGWMLDVNQWVKTKTVTLRQNDSYRAVVKKLAFFWENRIQWTSVDQCNINGELVERGSLYYYENNISCHLRVSFI